MESLGERERGGGGGGGRYSSTQPGYDSSDLGYYMV